MEPWAASHVTFAMTSKPKPKNRIPAAAPKRGGGKGAPDPAVEPSAESLVPDALPETERVERQNDFA
jgi:hypothetical protein